MSNLDLTEAVDAAARALYELHHPSGGRVLEEIR